MNNCNLTKLQLKLLKFISTERTVQEICHKFKIDYFIICDLVHGDEMRCITSMDEFCEWIQDDYKLNPDPNVLKLRITPLGKQHLSTTTKSIPTKARKFLVAFVGFLAALVTIISFIVTLVK